MQYVAGESLADRLGREGRLPFADVVRIGAQVARGLAAAHAKGLVHRDIKPANILLEAGTGRAKIADFGLAKAVGDGSLTVAGTVAGTPEFMSPEQATGGLSGAVVDARSDLFSLGVVLHALCSGSSPFRAESPLLTLDRVRREQPDTLNRIDPTLPDWFCAVVDNCSGKTPRTGSRRRRSWPTSWSRRGDSADAHDPHDSARNRDDLPSAATPATLPTALVGRGGVCRSGRVRDRRRLYANRTRPENERAAQSPPPQPDSKEQPAPPRPTQTGFVIVGKAETYRHLSEAVVAAGDGAVIEVHGDGPFRTPPLRHRQQAAHDPQPRRVPPGLRQGPAAVRAKQPFVTADADLRLEGLEIHWEMEDSFGWSEAELLGAIRGRVHRRSAHTEPLPRRHGSGEHLRRRVRRCRGAEPLALYFRRAGFLCVLAAVPRRAARGGVSVRGPRRDIRFHDDRETERAFRARATWSETPSPRKRP